MTLLLDDSIAVYEITTGDLLWKKEHSTRPKDPFITENITGYFGTTFEERETDEELSSVYIYDTASGDPIATLPLRNLSTINIRTLQPATKGSLLCFWDDVTVHVIKVDGKKAKRYEFTFPVDHFIKTMPYSDQVDTVAKVKKAYSPVGSLVGTAGPSKHEKASGCTIEYDEIYELLGFVGKTNILLGSVNVNEWDRMVLFSLDLDVAIAAGNEEEVTAAFNLPLAHEWSTGTMSETGTYKPLFKLDRTKVGMELVGVTREEYVWKCDAKYTVDNCYFVTEMQYPNE